MRMLDELQVQLIKPQVWVGLAVTAVIAFGIYRFGQMLLQQLQGHIDSRLLQFVKILWFLCVLLSWLCVATYVAYIPSAGFFFETGQSIVSGLEQTTGRVLVVVILAAIAWNLTGSITKRIVASDDFNRRSVRINTLKGVIESTLKVFIVIISVIAVFRIFGFDATGLLAGVSILGLAVGFGAQSLIKDVFTGFFILLEDQYGVGDVIAVNTGLLSGSVERLNLRVTALRALDGTVHIIPNGQIATVSVSSKDWSRVVATIDVTYNANINHAIKVLTEVSNSIYEDEEWASYFLEPPEVHGVTELAPDGVTLRALFKVQPKSQYPIGREFNRRIKIAMDQAGIEIPSPQRSVNFSSGPLEIRLTHEGNLAAQPTPPASTEPHS